MVTRPILRQHAKILPLNGRFADTGMKGAFRRRQKRKMREAGPICPENASIGEVFEHISGRGTLIASKPEADERGITILPPVEGSETVPENST
ncbi:hypothetical protein ACO34A_17625 [Rhizobium sp. ACO-34A]|nr:hypothetical protein ACO34A_17625 [Rhizobium sp. ACO-34A]